MAKKRFAILIWAILSLGLFITNIAAESDGDVKAFLGTLENAIGNMNTYRCIMISEYWKGKIHEEKTTKFHFKKPNLMRMDVLEGRKRGSTVVLNKKGKIRGPGFSEKKGNKCKDCNASMDDPVPP